MFKRHRKEGFFEGAFGRTATVRKIDKLIEDIEDDLKGKVKGEVPGVKTSSCIYLNEGVEVRGPAPRELCVSFDVVNSIAPNPQWK